MRQQSFFDAATADNSVLGFTEREAHRMWPSVSNVSAFGTDLTI